MCGIAGLVLNLGKVEIKKLNSTINFMNHRGPDAFGSWTSKDEKIGFSHSRLSIVDIEKRSNQPFSIEKGNFVIVFNGEIYNYLKLKNLLVENFNVKFKTNSDTEVLLFMYKYYGVKCLDYLKGMFAFAIFDKKKNETFLARDFIGQKPLIYSIDKTGFYFASEIPTLFKINPNLSKEIDKDSLKLYLIDNFFHIPAPYTIFKNIKKLEYGTYLIVKDGAIIKKKKYYQIKKLKDYSIDESLILHSLKEMEPLEVSYGAFLSGGIDSSYICANLKKVNKNIKSYTLRVDKKNDKDYIRSKYVSNKLKLNQEVVDADDINILKSIRDIVKLNGEPYYHRTSIYADEILKKVKKSHKVMFSGAGGDEIYYGYDNLILLKVDFFLKLKFFFPFIKYFLPSKYNFLKNSNKDNLKQNYFMQNTLRRENLFSSDLNKKSKVDSYFKNILSDFKKTVDYNNYIDFSYMFGLLVENSHSLVIQSDLIGMKNSIEIRSLFLEKDIIENAYSIPFRKKIWFTNLHEGKKVLRNYLNCVFSKKFLYSKKIGFGVKSNAEKLVIEKHSKKIEQKIRKLSKRDFFNDKILINLVKDFSNNYDLIMKLYALEIWFEIFYDKR